MKPLTTADQRVYMGVTGSGKSTLARHQIQKHKRILIFDPNEETEHVISGAVVIYRPSELVAAVQNAGAVRIVWRGFRSMRNDAFEFGNRCAWAAGDFAVLWDEVDRFCRKGAALPEYAYQMVHTGRHRRIRLFSCSRRPASINIDIRSQASRMMTATMHEPADVKALGERMGSAAAELPTLREYHFLDWSEKGASVRKAPFH